MAILGATFLLPKPSQQTEHLWVVITEPDPQTNQTIIVNLTTKRSHSDKTTVLKVGDHPFITRDSVIFYDDARLCEAALLNDPIIKKRMLAPFSAAVLARVQAGLLQSSRTPQKIKTIFKLAQTQGRT